MATYGISVGCVLWRRLKLPETLPPVYWSLGKWGILVNSIGVVYAIYSFFWAFWPIYWQPTAEEVNAIRNSKNKSGHNEANVFGR
jgi:choline transport protein